jgi:hypothetical protein
MGLTMQTNVTASARGWRAAMVATAALVTGLVLAAAAGAQPPSGPPGPPAPEPTPVQLHLRGLFSEGDVNLGDTILGSRSYTIPEATTLLITYATCRAVSNAAEHVQIFLTAESSLPGVIQPIRLVEMITDRYIEIGAAFPQRRHVDGGPVQAYLGVTSPGGSTIGRTLTLQAQRDTTQGSGGVECAVAGQLTG